MLTPSLGFYFKFPARDEYKTRAYLGDDQSSGAHYWGRLRGWFNEIIIIIMIMMIMIMIMIMMIIMIMMMMIIIMMIVYLFSSKKKPIPESVPGCRLRRHTAVKLWPL